MFGCPDVGPAAGLGMQLHCHGLVRTERAGTSPRLPLGTGGLNDKGQEAEPPELSAQQPDEPPDPSPQVPGGVNSTSLFGTPSLCSCNITDVVGIHPLLSRGFLFDCIPPAHTHPPLSFLCCFGAIPATGEGFLTTFASRKIREKVAPTSGSTQREPLMSPPLCPGILMGSTLT